MPKPTWRQGLGQGPAEAACRSPPDGGSNAGMGLAGRASSGGCCRRWLVGAAMFAAVFVIFCAKIVACATSAHDEMAWADEVDDHPVHLDHLLGEQLHPGRARPYPLRPGDPRRPAAASRRASWRSRAALLVGGCSSTRRRKRSATSLFLWRERTPVLQLPLDIRLRLLRRVRRHRAAALTIMGAPPCLNHRHAAGDPAPRPTLASIVQGLSPAMTVGAARP